MTLLLTFLAAAVLAPVLFARLWGLAPTRGGWLYYLANVVWETLEKRLKRSRFLFESGAVFLGLLLLLLAGHDSARVALVLSAFLGLELLFRKKEREILTGVPLELDEQGLSASSVNGDASGVRYPAPCVHPQLTVTVSGPFVSRKPCATLGLLPEGVSFALEVTVGNHTPAPTQGPVRVNLEYPDHWQCEQPVSLELGRLASGACERIVWKFTPGAGPEGSCRLRVCAGKWEGEQQIGYGACRRMREEEWNSARITRWPGARRSAFAWRGDMDVYDSSSFQSIRGLKAALELARQYGITQTMVTSTRLTLDEASAKAWAAHYGVDRDAGDIPVFADWLKREAHLCHRNPYPAKTEGKSYTLEIGNHGHLHYDTDASGDPGNNWRQGVKPGEGNYSWTGNDKSSFGEQKDNILEATRWFERMLNYTPRTWAKPGRGNDRDTPRAVEAAGIRVASGSDIRPRDNVLRQPPPHHPSGTSIVELTARYPSDPRHAHHAWMQVFWMHRAWRKGIPMVYMCHQHMRQFEGHACTRITEFLLRRVLESFNGDFFVDTLYGLGTYWLDVLNPDTRKVHVRIENGTLFIENQSDESYQDLPIDITLKNISEPLTILVSLQPEESKTLSLSN